MQLTWPTVTLLAVMTLSAGQCAMMSPDERLNLTIISMLSDSIAFSAGDMGVERFEWIFPVDNPIYPHSPKEFNVKLLAFMRLTTWKGKGFIRGFLVAETRDAGKAADGVAIEPVLILRTKTVSKRTQHAWSVRCHVHSYWDPPTQSAMVYPFEHNFTLPASGELNFELLLDLEPTPKAFRPLKQLNLLDGRGLEIPPVQPGLRVKRETFVIIKPIYNFTPTVHGHVIERHVQYYQTLGVSKHIIYLRRDQAPLFLKSTLEIHRLVLDGKIIIVLWDQLPQHEVWLRQYDSRVVNSHSMLAFFGMDVYLLPIDIDEYLVSAINRVQQSNIQEIIEYCGGVVAEVRVQRYNSVCKACDRGQPEILIWANNLNVNHPLSWYHLSNFMDVPSRRAIVNPNFVRGNSVVLPDSTNSSQPKAKCMSFLHIVNMMWVKHDKKLVESQYVEDHSWLGMLKRFRNVPAPPQVKVAGTPGHARKLMAAHPLELANASSAQMRLISQPGLSASSWDELDDGDAPGWTMRALRMERVGAQLMKQ